MSSTHFDWFVAIVGLIGLTTVGGVAGSLLLMNLRAGLLAPARST